MIKFLIYLFESGICMLILYLVYWFFLRKETYFTFNRIYLVGSILLVLLVPFIHVHLSISMNRSLGEPAMRIMQFRDYYQELIAMTDPYYHEIEYRDPSTMENGFDTPVSSYGSSAGTLKEPSDIQEIGEAETDNLMNIGSWGISPARIILLLYIGGVVYFLFRLLFLCLRLFYLTRKNNIIRKNGFRLVDLREDFSPFSFFRFVFINLKSISEKDLEKMLAHETAHVRQKHTMDHLFAHGLAVFQWFNPFAWQIRNALKTVHEYIADKAVLDQGFRLFDYQSLLLKQVITYHSVELVNNFNLKPIKNRITMMTKIRSGMPARLKALVVIPFALLIFILFAEFTFTGPDKTVLNIHSIAKEKKITRQLEGLWKNNSHDSYGQLVFFDAEKMSILEEQGKAREYFYRVDNNEIIVSPVPDIPANSSIGMKYTLREDVLTIWWSDAEECKYSKTPYQNSMDLILSKNRLNIDLPVISRYRILENQDRVLNIFLGYPDEGRSGEPELVFLGRKISYEEFPGILNETKNKIKAIDQPYLTVVFHVDKEIPMGYLSKLKLMLRENKTLKIADAGIPIEDQVSPVLRHAVGLPRLLPPPDALIIEEEEIRAQGIEIFKINLTSHDLAPADLHNRLIEIARNNEKYVMVLEYDSAVPYGEYMETVDMIFDAVYVLREELALSKYNIPYEDLGSTQQQEIKKTYPMTLTERNVDDE